MAAEDNKERIQSLELAIKEQRKDYDVLHALHEALKVKNLTFLATALGILGYLYAGSDPHASLKEKLFIPPQPYGVVFYVAGLSLLLGSIAGFIVVLVRNRVWKTAFENDQHDKLMNNYQEYLEYVHKRYKSVSNANGDCYEKRRYLLNNSFIALLLGAIILVLLKTFKG